LLLLVLGLDAGIRGGGIADAAWTVGLVAAVFACVVLHELGHCLQVRRYGIRVRDIILLPIGGMARAESIPDCPRKEIIVAIAGPVVNFALAALFGIVVWLRGGAFELERDILANLVAVNLVLGTFNLVPAFPMDGGRILRGLLAMKMPYATATRYAKNVGQVVALVFVVAGFYFAQLTMLPVIAIFIFWGAITEEQMLLVKQWLDGKRARDFMPHAVPVMESTVTVEAALGELPPGVNVVPVTDATGDVAGVVDVPTLRHAVADGRGSEPLSRYAKAGFPVLRGDTPAVQAYHLLRNRRAPVAGIIRANRFVGLVFLRNLSPQAG
jgi:stage IV sporulation protein FB